MAAKIQGRDVKRPEVPAPGPDSSASLADVLRASVAAAAQRQESA